MSTRKTLLIVAGLLGSTILVTGALSGAGAFGGGRGGCGGPGFDRQGGPGFGPMGGPRMGGDFGGRGGLRFADANKDGVVTRDEATARRDKRFESFDLDKNGEVTADEAINSIIRRFEGEVRRKVRMFDANGDGKVTKEEFAAPVLERFASRDTNGDGQLSADEMPQRMMRGGGHRRHGWHGSRRGWGWGGPDAPADMDDDGPDAGPEGSDTPGGGSAQ